MAVIEDLLDYAKEHGATGFQFVLEVPGRRIPIDGVVGRFRADPKRLLGELVVVKGKLARMASAEG